MFKLFIHKKAKNLSFPHVNEENKKGKVTHKFK